MMNMLFSFIYLGYFSFHSNTKTKNSTHMCAVDGEQKKINGLNLQNVSTVVINYKVWMYDYNSHPHNTAELKSLKASHCKLLKIASQKLRKK